MGLAAFFKSVLLSCAAAQAVVLLATGLFHSRGNILEGASGLFALPMTLVFFGIPQLVISIFVIGLATAVFGTVAKSLAPMLVGCLGIVWLIIAILNGINSTQQKNMGFNSTLHLFIGASLVIWAVYAYFWLEFRGKNA